MTDREKLAELICDSVHRKRLDFPEAAGYLLANGVVVREKGEWMPLGQRTSGSGGGRNYTHYCKQCGQHGFEDYVICPNCGADMRKGESDGRLQNL